MILLLSRKVVESVLTMEDCLSAVEAAFGELARDNAIMPQRSVIKIEEHAGLCLGMPAFIPCTPAGIVHLLTEYHVELDGAHAVVIGRSPILGRPMASMLINRHATVTLCHSRTRSLPTIVRGADVIIAAVGRPRFVQGGWIKVGAVVIDAGYNEGNIGDVDFDGAVEPASLITPVPGGVGPMTIATLIDHTADAAAMQLGVQL